MKQKFLQLSNLLKWNLSLIPENKKTPYSAFDKENAGKKEEGMSVGKIVRNFENGIIYLLKKNGRFYDFNEKEELVKEEKARDADIEEGIKMSFNEMCAAVLFADLKGSDHPYLPEMLLVTSPVDTKKQEHKLKAGTGLEKVFIASAIITNNASSMADVVKDINDETKGMYNASFVAGNPKRGQEPHPESMYDLMVNAVIMMLLSNYDIKPDNYIRRETKNGKTDMVPIDFGNARMEESLSSEVMSGIDLCRTVSHPNNSDIYSSPRLREDFSVSAEYQGTQKFYNKYLKPEHFLGVIAKIKVNQAELERKLWKDAYIYTFGTEEEKKQYADVVVARVRNLVKLEPLFAKCLAEEKDFGKHNVRDLATEDSDFTKSLLGKESVAENFFNHIDYVFRGITEKNQELLDLLKQYNKDESSKTPESESIILGKVELCNEFLNEHYMLMQKEFGELERFYKDSDYISGSDGISKENSWKGCKKEISSRVTQIFETINAPLIEGDEESLPSQFPSRPPSAQGGFIFEGWGKDDDGDDLSTGSAESRLPQHGVKWDMSKSQEYETEMSKMLGYIEKESKWVKNKMLPLMTHLGAYDTLVEVQKERFEKIALEPAKPLEAKDIGEKPSEGLSIYREEVRRLSGINIDYNRAPD